MEQTDKRGFIKGEILFTIFENEAEHFSIAKIKIHETNEDYAEKDIVGKGYFSNLQIGVVYQFFGHLETAIMEPPRETIPVIRFAVRGT